MVFLPPEANILHLDDFEVHSERFYSKNKHFQRVLPTGIPKFSPATLLCKVLPPYSKSGEKTRGKTSMGGKTLRNPSDAYRTLPRVQVRLMSERSTDIVTKIPPCFLSVGCSVSSSHQCIRPNSASSPHLL